ncbi:hypothetical protein Hdeb2414_s0013g00406921 [Helianthus debilis subsp. tardiflorus]
MKTDQVTRPRFRKCQGVTSYPIGSLGTRWGFRCLARHLTVSIKIAKLSKQSSVKDDQAVGRDCG